MILFVTLLIKTRILTRVLVLRTIDFSLMVYIQMIRRHIITKITKIDLTIKFYERAKMIRCKGVNYTMVRVE